MKDYDRPASPINGEYGQKVENAEGLTKLEYAAIRIMAASVESNSERNCTATELAEVAVICAKALLEELEK